MRNCSQIVSIAGLLLGFAASGHAGARRKQKEEYQDRVVTTAIQPQVAYKVSREIGAGRMVAVRTGKPGIVKRTYRVAIKDGKVTDKELVKEERSEPESALYLIGHAGFSAGRGDFIRRKVLDMSASAYAAFTSGTSRTATGRRAGYGVVAVDPHTIRLGTLLYVEGYGLALACDTGGAIRGNRIDLCFPSNGQCEAFGRRKVRVHILN